MIYKYLALLPAILSFTGFVIYLLLRKKNETSPIVKIILETIKSKSENLPELDKRLGARQVFKIINKHEEFRKRLSKNDYDLLLYAIRAENRRKVLYGIITFFILGISIFAYFKLEQYQNRLSFADLIIYGHFNNREYFTPTTKDDLVLKWDYEGENEEVEMSITSITENKKVDGFRFYAKDKKIIIRNQDLQELWGCPGLRDVFQIRVSIQTDKDIYTFGPFDIKTALTVIYYFQKVSNKIEIATQTMNCGLLTVDYDITIVAWSKNELRIESLDLNIKDGKAEGQFPEDFEIDKASIKIGYYGKYSDSIVRIEEL